MKKKFAKKLLKVVVITSVITVAFIVVSSVGVVITSSFLENRTKSTLSPTQLEAIPKEREAESSPPFTTEKLLIETNAYRTGSGVSTLELDPILNDSAQRKCEDIVISGIADHNIQEFQNLANTLNRSMGENLAEGYGASKDVITAWSESPTHRNNLVDSDWQRIGFGICTSPTLGPIVVQHFSN